MFLCILFFVHFLLFQLFSMKKASKLKKVIIEACITHGIYFINSFLSHLGRNELITRIFNFFNQKKKKLKICGISTKRENLLKYFKILLLRVKQVRLDLFYVFFFLFIFCKYKGLVAFLVSLFCWRTCLIRSSIFYYYDYLLLLLLFKFTGTI